MAKFNGNSVERTDTIADFTFSDVVYTLIQEMLTKHPYIDVGSFEIKLSLSIAEMLIEMDKEYTLRETREALNKASIDYLEIRRSKE